MSELLVTGLSEVATPLGSAPRRGSEQGWVLRLREEPEILCRNGRIAFVGPRRRRLAELGELREVPRLHLSGTAIPGLVDAHTHLPWAGFRDAEFVERLRGVSYQEIAARGGGILATVRATREATLEELEGLLQSRLDLMLASGTTTAEAKSGYGLELATELRQLEAIARVQQLHPVRLVPTLLAAHEVPIEFREQRERYLDLVCEGIIPAVAERGLARFCDVFCEEGVFTPAESRRVLEAGLRAGLKPRLHADEFRPSGGAEVAALVGAASADHLMAVTEAGIEALARAGVIAVLLPGTSFFLRLERYAPARRLIEAGVPIALGTDCNPGSCYCESLLTVIQLAVFVLGLSVEEALVAATLNSAASLDLASEIGTLEVGKKADFVVLDAPNLWHLAYHFGVPLVSHVVVGGELVYERRISPQLARNPHPPRANAGSTLVRTG